MRYGSRTPGWIPGTGMRLPPLPDQPSLLTTATGVPGWALAGREHSYGDVWGTEGALSSALSSW